MGMRMDERPKLDVREMNRLRNEEVRYRVGMNEKVNKWVDREK